MSRISLLLQCFFICTLLWSVHAELDDELSKIMEDVDGDNTVFSKVTMVPRGSVKNSESIPTQVTHTAETAAPVASLIQESAPVVAAAKPTPVVAAPAPVAIKSPMPHQESVVDEMNRIENQVIQQNHLSVPQTHSTPNSGLFNADETRAQMQAQMMAIAKADAPIPMTSSSLHSSMPAVIQDQADTLESASKTPMIMTDSPLFPQAKPQAPPAAQAAAAKAAEASAAPALVEQSVSSSVSTSAASAVASASKPVSLPAPDWAFTDLQDEEAALKDRVEESILPYNLENGEQPTIVHDHKTSNHALNRKRSMSQQSLMQEKESTHARHTFQMPHSREILPPAPTGDKKYPGLEHLWIVPENMKRDSDGALVEVGTENPSVVEVPANVGNLAWSMSTGVLDAGASLQNGATWSAGTAPHTGVITLNGKDQYIDLKQLNFGGTAATYRIWARIRGEATAQNWARFFDFGNGAGSDNIILTRIGTESNKFQYEVYSGGKKENVQFSLDYDAETWLNIVIVHYQNTMVIVYVGGAELTRGAVVLPTKIVRKNCWIGRSNWVSDAYFNGDIDYFGVWFNEPVEPAKILTMNDADVATPCEIKNGGCDPLSRCILDPTNSFAPPTCGKCPSGYIDMGMDGKSKCEDIDECGNANGGCDPLTRCENTPGSRNCGQCPKGWSGRGDVPCIDVDECLFNNGGCDRLSECTNTLGSRRCSACPTGYTGSGDTQCMDLDECLTNNGGCDTMVPCRNLIGSRECGKCPKGYSGAGDSKCADVDECQFDNGGCDPSTRCINRPGSRECGDCPSGFVGNGLTGCKDIDECIANNGGCDALTTCMNTIGARECGECPLGYDGNGAQGCVDVDECALLNGGCHPLARCINTPGSRECGECPEGFVGNGYTGCQDVNECSINNGGCDPLTSCINMQGGHVCGPCPKGYRGAGANGCIQLNVCEIVPNGGCDPLTKCIPAIKTRAGRVCTPCPRGMLGDGASGCKPDKRFVKYLRMEKELELIQKGGNAYGKSYDVDYMQKKVSQNAIRKIADVLRPTAVASSTGTAATVATTTTTVTAQQAQTANANTAAAISAGITVPAGADLTVQSGTQAPSSSGTAGTTTTTSATTSTSPSTTTTSTPTTTAPATTTSTTKP